MKAYPYLSLGAAAATLASASLAQDSAVHQVPTPTQAFVPTNGSTPQFASSDVDVIFSSITGHPTADVPGNPGLHFQNTSGHTAPFDKPFGSANGHWIMAADTDALGTADDTLILDGVLVEREGNVASWATVGGSTYGPFQIRQGVNSNGEYVFKNNTSETSTADDYVVKVTAGPTYTVLAREALDIPQLPGAETWNDNLEGVLIADNGDVGFEANAIQGASTANDEIYVFGNSLLYQEGITVPSNQAGGGSEPMQAIAFEDTWVSPDGAHVLYRGDLGGAAPTTDDDVLVYDGAVVLQENQIIPGSSFANPIDGLGIVECALDFAGNWYARGNNDTTEEDWVVRNGVVIAQVGGPIFTGSTELWDDTIFADCFFQHTGDSLGNYVVAGVTDNVDPNVNGVIVLNNTTVLVREGDPIDVDNNGLFDDNAFFNTFGNDKCVLNDLGEFLFVGSIRDGAGTVFAQGLFKMQAIASGPTTYCTAGTSTNGCVPAIGAAGTPSVAASSGFVISVANVEGQKQGLLFYGVSGQHNAPWGTSSSFLCVKAPTQRMGTQFSGGTAGLCDGALSEDWLAYIAAHPGALGTPFSAGQVVNAQGWYRDPPSPKTTNLSDGLEFTLEP